MLACFYLGYATSATNAALPVYSNIIRFFLKLKELAVLKQKGSYT